MKYFYMAILFLLFGSLARGQVVKIKGSPKSAKELQEFCTATGPKAAMKLYCVGFVEATVWMNLLPLSLPDGSRLVKELSEGYTFEQFTDAFIIYLQQHPEEYEHSAQEVLTTAWADHKMIKTRQERPKGCTP